MKTAVCIPHRPQDDERVANLACSKARWEKMGFEVFHADSEGPVFSRSQAINKSVKLADADAFIVADADILLDDSVKARQALKVASERDAFVVCFHELRILDWPETRAVRDGADPARQPYMQRVGMTWGQCLAMSRTLFDKVGGFDERFVGYGCEDLAFYVCCSTFTEAVRVRGTAYHLRHIAGEGGATYDNNVLYNQYLAVQGDEEAMMVLVESR